MPLSGPQKRFLKALAHPLNPVVQIGKAGLTAPVVLQIDEALRVHELIKIKLGKECPVTTEDVTPLIETQTGSDVVQTLGHTVVAYRRNPERPKIELPKKTKRVRPRPSGPPGKQ